MTKFLHISFFLFLFLTTQLFAPSINDKSTQLQLTENEKIWLTLHPVIKVGIDPDYAPYEWVDEDGKHTGMVVDYLKKLEDILGIRFEFIKDKSWAELLNMAKKSKLDMLTSIVKTPKRSEYLTFSEPYRHTPTIIIDNGNGSFIGSLKQLSGKKVSVEKGYFMAEFIKNNYPSIILMSALNTKEALNMVANGEVDAFVGDANIVDYKIKINDFDTLRFSGQTEYISHQGFGLSRGNEPLATILTKAMATIPKEESDAMFNRWLNIDQGVKSEILIKYGLVITLVFLIIAYWVYVLKREIKHRKEAEEKLRESESLYRNLTENMEDVIWKVDKDFYFTYVSPSVEKTIGYSPDELIGHHVFEIFTEEGIATATKRMRNKEYIKIIRHLSYNINAKMES